MSELYVKRQRICKEMRRADIEEYLRKRRLQMLYTSKSTEPQKNLTPQELDHLYNQLEKHHYSTSSLLLFLQTIRSRHPSSLNSPLLFIRLRFTLEYLLKEKEMELAQKMVISICGKVVSESLSNPAFLENCFRQFLELIQNHDFKLHQIWPGIAMMRNEVFFTKSFTCFLEYVRSYPSEIDQMVSLMLETLMNFTLDNANLPKLRLNSNQYFQVAGTISKLLQHFTLTGTDLSYAALTLQNVAYAHSIDLGLEIINISQIIHYFLKALDHVHSPNDFVDNPAIKSVMELIGMSLSGSQEKCMQIVKKNPSIIKILCKMLPIDCPFKKILHPRPVQWTHKNITVIIGAMLCLCNLALFQGTRFQLINSGTLGLVIQLSSFSSSRVKQEVAIFLWNMLIVGTDETAYILCENDFLYALSNILTAEYSNEALRYGVKSLELVLKKAKSSLPNSNFWHVPIQQIKQMLLRFDAFRSLERLIMSKDNEIAQKAANCIEILHNIDEHI